MPVNFKRRRIGGVASIYEVYDDPEVTAYAMQKGDLIIYEPSAGDPVWFIKETTGSNTDISPVIRPIPAQSATAQTVGSVTVTAITIPVATDTAINVSFTVSGKDAASTNRVTAEYLASFRDDSATLSQVNGGPDLVTIVSDTTMVGGNSDVLVNDALIQVVGRGGQTWDWRVDVIITEILL